MKIIKDGVPANTWGPRPTPEVVTLPAHPGGPTDGALAMVEFLLLRLAEDEHLIGAMPNPLPLARHLGAIRALAEAWVRLHMDDPDPLVEVQTWRRGFGDGILLGLLAACQPYRDHPNWDEEWDS